MYGCRVVGVCGTAAKCEWLLRTLHFDGAVNYRSPTFAADLRAATGRGVDAFFDSVGGPVHGAIVQRMNEGGRIAVSGALATTNTKGLAPPQSEYMRTHRGAHHSDGGVDFRDPASYDVHRYFVAQQLQMRGFSVWDHAAKWTERIEQIAALLRTGDVRNYETVLDGFEWCPDALSALLRGEHRGRVVVKV